MFRCSAGVTKGYTQQYQYQPTEGNRHLKKTKYIIILIATTFRKRTFGCYVSVVVGWTARYIRREHGRHQGSVAGNMFVFDGQKANVRWMGDVHVHCRVSSPSDTYTDRVVTARLCYVSRVSGFCRDWQQTEGARVFNKLQYLTRWWVGWYTGQRCDYCVHTSTECNEYWRRYGWIFPQQQCERF